MMLKIFKYLYEHRMKKLLFICLLFIVPTALFCIDDEYSRATLKGLENFGVIVHLDGIEELNEARLRTDTESKLKSAGIQIIEAGDMQSVRDAMIKVEVIGYEAFSGHYYSFGIRIEVRQHGAFKPRNREGFVGDVETWSLWTVGMVGQRDIDFITGTVEEYLEMFISAYYSVNQRE
jgi:hypothetical protein